MCHLDLDNAMANTFRVKVRALASSFVLAAVFIGIVSARLQRPEAAPQLTEPPLQLAPSEIEIYKRAQTLIDWTPRQIHACPFLHNLRPAGSQDQLPMVLERAGQTATLLFHAFPQVSCDEEVGSISNPQDARTAFENVHYTPKNRKFRYIVIPPARR
jgi:hypothetical protein